MISELQNVYNSSKVLWSLCILVSGLKLYSQEIKLKDKIVQDYNFSVSKDGLFTKNSINISLKLRQADTARGGLYYKILTDTDSIVNSGNEEILITEKKSVIVIDSLPENESFYVLKYFFKEHISKEVFGGKINFGVGINKIEAKQNKPIDFDKFWKTSIDSLATFKSMPQVQRLIKLEKETHSVEKIEINSFNNVSITSFLIKPRTIDTPKVLVHFIGYKGNNYPQEKFYLNNYAVLLVNVRGHGASNKDFNPGFKNHEFLTHEIENKHNYTYRGVILDGIRAIDYIFTRNDMDNENIYVHGGSQGGGISLILSSLDKRIKACLSDIPFLTDFNNSLKITKWPSSVFLSYAKEKNISIEKILETLSYFDTLNFVDKIQIPTLISIGLQDETCPPRSIFNMTHLINEDVLEEVIYKKSGHGLPESHFQYKLNWLNGIHN